MDKLKECKNFGDLYNVIKEENFGTVAYGLATILCYAPLIAGIINYLMTVNEPYYDPYEYNYKCMTLWNFIFSIMLIWFFVYFLGKIHINKLNIKGLIKTIREKQRWMLFWLALFIWTIIPIAFSCDPMGAIWGTTFLSSGYVSHLHMLGVMMCIYMIVDNAQRERLVWHFVIVSDVLAMIMLAYEYGIPFLRIFTLAPGVSTYTNSNHYGYIIVMAFMAIVGLYYRELSMDKKDRNTFKELLCIVSMVINVYALMINDTLGAYLAIVFTVIIILPIWRIRTGSLSIRHIFPHLIIVAFTLMSYYGFITSVLGSTIGPSLVVFINDLFRVKNKVEGYENAGTGRIALWKDTISRIKQRPIVGYGPDLIMDKDRNALIWNTPHNEFLECAFFMGIPGLVLYLGGLIRLCIDKCKLLKNISMNELIAAGVIIGYLASSFFGVRKFNTVCYFFMFIGILMREEQRKRGKKSNKQSRK